MSLSTIPFPVASSSSSTLNTAVATDWLEEAVGKNPDEIRVIVSMDREFTDSDVRFFEEHDAKLYSRLKTLPIAIVGLDVEGVIALSWRDGVLNLDLDRELQYFMETAVISTNAGAIWADEANTFLTNAAPVEIGGKAIDGSGVAVAVVDSGIDGTHPDLANRVIANYKHVCSTPGLSNGFYDRCYGNALLDPILLGTANETAGTPNPWTEPWVPAENSDTSSGHGTHVAGTVAGDGTATNGRVKGAAPGASLVGFGAGDAILVGGALESWDFIYQNYEDFADPIRVVTNSFGDCPGTKWVENRDEPAFRMIEKLVQEKGVVFTFAAGNVDTTCDLPNDGSVDATSTYCDYAHYIPGVLCVANGNDMNSGQRTNMSVAGSSSRGQESEPTTWPEITAPGTDIMAPYASTGATMVLNADSSLRYANASGTSMATPHVAGIIALLAEAAPGLTPVEIEQTLKDTAFKFTHGAAYTPDGAAFDKGHGLVDALAAVNAALGTSHTGSSFTAWGGSLQPWHYNPIFGHALWPAAMRDIEVFTTVEDTEIRVLNVGLPEGYEATSSNSHVEFEAADGTVHVLPVTVSTVDGAPQLATARAPLDLPGGEYTLRAVSNGFVLDEQGAVVLNVPESTPDPESVIERLMDTIPPLPACVDATMSVSFKPDGIALTGTITNAPARVDTVRVDGFTGEFVGAVSRTDAAGITTFEIPLTADAAAAGTDLGVTFLTSTIPCFANVHVPESTPENLESTQPAGVFQPGNPWLNPGFEFASPMEWDSALSPDWRAQARSVAPPTYLRAYDHESGTPHSTHEVAYGNGTSGNALLLHYNASDDGRNLILGQFFGPPETGPWVWLGADTIEFEYKTETALDDFQATVHFVPEGGEQTGIGGRVTVDSDGEWHRAVVDVSAIPDNATLTGAVIRVAGAESGDVMFDNVRVTGSTFTLVDLHSDLSDGYSMLVFPETADETVGAVDALNVAPLVTGKGEAFVAQTKLRDFTGITPEWVDARDAKYFIFGIAGQSYVENGWSTDGLERDIKGAVKSDGSAVAFAVDKAATLAQTDNGLGVAYAYWNISQVREANDRLVYSGEGYFSAFKNSVQNYSLADQLDAAVTPVRLLDEDATSEVHGLENASIVITTPQGGSGFSVRVDPPATGWIEETTLSVTGYPDRTVVLDGSGESFFENYAGSADGLRADLAGTIFVRGDAFVSGNPVPTIFVCKAPDHAPANGCRDREEAQSVKSLEEMHFDASSSEDPNGEGLHYQWDFGDDTGAEGVQVTHVYTTPGTYDVTLAVTDTTGATETASTTVTVLNRAPNVTAMIPPLVTRVDNLTVPVIGTDADGVVESLLVEFDGETIATVDAATTQVTIPKEDLTLGDHSLTVTAWDDHDASVVNTVTFTVENLVPTVDLDASDVLVGKGSEVTFTPMGEDADSPNLTLTLAFGDGAEEDVTAGEPVTHTFATAGEFPVTLTADDGEGGVVNTTLTLVVDGAAPVTSASVQDGAWHTENVTIELTAVDDHTDATTFFKVDDGNFTTYEDAFEVGGDGTHTVTFYSVDALGNEEAHRTITVKIDSGLPVIDMSGMPADFEVVAGERQLAASAADDGSGVASVRILIDGEECGAGIASAECAWDTSETTLGFFELTVEATDVAGNVATQSVAVLVMNGLVMPLDASFPAIL